MKLRRLYVSQFKQFVEPFELKGLNNGLVVITGANEAGKSTLSLALRSAFFERHNTSTVSVFRPYGDSSARPEVHVEFELHNQHAVLEKSFLRQARCDLQIGSDRYDGTQAEEHLAAQLGFNLRMRGNSGVSDWGVPGLLWVQQGELHNINEAVAAATNHLGEALGASMGALVSSDSDEVLNEVERRLAELITTTAKPRAEYLKSINDEQSLTEQVALLSKEAERYKSLVDQLDLLLAQFKREQKQEAWVRLKDQIPGLQAELDQAQQHEVQLTQLVAKLKGLEQEQHYLSQAVKAIEAEEAHYSELEQTQTTLSIAVQTAGRDVDQAKTAKDKAELAHQHAKQKLDDAMLYAQWLTKKREHDQWVQRHADLSQTLAKAQSLQQSEQELRAALPIAPITTKVLDELIELERRCALLEAQRQMVSTRLQFELLSNQGITVAGRPLASLSETVHLSEPTVVSIDGVGSIQLTPGGQDLAELNSKLQTTQASYKAKLKQHGLSDLNQAQAQHRVYEQLQLDLARIKGELLHSAPDGVAALSLLVAELAQRIQSESITVAFAEQGESNLTIEQAQAQEQEAYLLLQRTTRLLQEAQQQQIELQVKWAGTQDELNRLKLHLHSDEQRFLLTQHRARAVELTQNIDSTRLEQTTLLAAKQQYRATATIQAEMESLERRAEQAYQAFNDLSIELSKIETEVRIVGAKGLDEQLLHQQAALAHTSRRVQQFKQHVESLSYLKNLLVTERARLREQLQAPLVARMQHYLSFLFPNSRIELTEDFAPRLLHRDGTHAAELKELSFGALEQIAIISRLAYADLLKEAGRPTLIVLDDVLAYSDVQRLERMKRAIDDAAKRHQIILFTCNPHMWSDAGGQVMSVEQRKLANSMSV